MTDHRNPGPDGMNPYESALLFSQYCELHFGEEYFGVANFPALCARICIERMGGRRKGRALDVGCAVGRATFELARVFAHVTGVDLSANFIGAAQRLRDTGLISYRLPVEGDLAIRVTRSLTDLELETGRDGVDFMVADAQALPEELTGYDLIFAGNLIDRLPAPRRFLSSVHQRLTPGGMLALTSPYTWLPQFTPREEWLGGFTAQGKDIYTIDGLKEALTPRFRMSGEPFDVPFVIRETARKYQHVIAQMTIWELV